jgi:hypothetical protein
MLSRLHFVRLLAIAFVTLGMCGMSASLVHASRVTPAAPQDSSLPKEIAGLMPKTAVDVSGGWKLAKGALGMGSLNAELPANHPCTGNIPGKIGIEILYYRDKNLATLTHEWPSMEEEQATRKKEYEKQVVEQQKSTPQLIRIGPVKTEDGPGGKILYYDSLFNCSEEKHQERPEVSLYAISHTDNLFVKIEISGYLTADEAKAFAIEVMTNIAKVDLSQLGK